MKKVLFAIMIAFFAGAVAQTSVYDFNAVNANGETVSLSQYRGKVLLIVNTATECGFTPQYGELEAIYERFGGMGFEVLDFPCNQFGAQAPGTIADIQKFCTRYNVTFTQFDKVDVNGAKAHPLFTYLKKQQGFKGFDKDNLMTPKMDEMLKKLHPDYKKTSDIKWNFTKFLVDQNGKVVARFEPTAEIDKIAMEIEKLLSK